MSTIVSTRDAIEQRRLAALHDYELLDHPAEDELEAVVRVAAAIAGVPTATINLIDENRQCQLTTVGFDGGDSPRTDSMCAIRFQTGEFVHVPDASTDPTYRDNPWVTGALADVRFYASAPLVTPDGHALGTLCVFDTVPRTLTDDQIARLTDLAHVVLALFERRRQAREYADLAATVERRRQFTDAVLDTVDVGIVAADQHGRLTLFNRTARDWHALDAESDLDPTDVAGHYNLFETDGVTPLPVDRIPLLRALADGEVTNAGLVIKARDRDPRHILSSGRSLTGADGNLLGAVVAMTDVTTDRKQRAALEQAQADLTGRSEQLAAVVADLKRSNTELASFAGVVSHDLLAPLGVVAGYLELLDDMHGDHLPDRARKWITTACQSITRMRELVTSLLDYAQAGNAPVRAQHTNLGDVVDQVLLDLCGCITDASASITATSPLPTVACDPTQIRQLLQNLIANAIKYRHPDRPCRITVTAVRDAPGHRDADRHEVTVAVIDNGIGIPAEHRQRVFDMFAQVDPAARTGHGIGLSTCQRIVDRHHGHIRADGNDTGGTTITFTLPTVALSPTTELAGH